MTFAILSKAQTFCNTNGNVILYSNYDGGNLKINIDQNITNIKIGICSYEAMNIEIVGTYSANVTEISYVGFNATNNHCGLGSNPTSFSAAATTSTSVNFLPTATYSNTNGYNSLICNYSCNNTSNQGGCNTPDQIVDYFMTKFGGTFYYHKTQYGCYTNSAIQNVSTGGNCCIQPPITTGIKNNIQANSFEAYPNPANNLLNVTFSNTNIENNITLVNELGQRVFFLKSSHKSEKINVKDLPRGIYFVLIEGEENSQQQKVILE